MGVRGISIGTGSGRLDSLTGLRFVAAFLVFVYHCTVLSVFADSGVQSAYSSWAGNAGALGVSFFFVLSGFVLTWSARPGDRPRQFWRRRAVKVLPNHVAAYALALVLLLAAGASIHPGSALATLFLVHSWIPDPHFVATSINGVTWSLSAEVVFYLLFPFVLLPLVTRIRESRLWYAFAGVGAAALLMPVVALTLLPADPPSPFAPDTSWPQMWFTHFFPLVRGLEFVLGMIMARIVLSGRWFNLGIAPAALLAGLVYVVSLQLPTIYGFASVYPLPLSFLIAAAATADVRGRQTWLRSRPMVWLGDISYAFFLLHLFVILNLHAGLGGDWAANVSQRPAWSTPVALLFLVGALLFCIMLAGLLHRFVEVPAMRRWSGSRRWAAGTPPAGNTPAGTRPSPPRTEPVSPPAQPEDARSETAGSPPAP